MSDEPSTNPESNGAIGLSLSLKVKRQPLEMEMEDGSIRKFFLQDIPGPSRNDWLKLWQSKSSGMNTDGSPRKMKDFNFHSDLISRCMVDENGNHVPKAMIEKWPGSVELRVFNACRELCGLTETALDLAKND
jgi:hypothetical protein